MSSSFLSLERVSRCFGTGHAAVQALSEVSFSLAAGEQAALIGPSGSGKTTLLNVVGALDRPSSGRVFIDGECSSAFSEAQAAEFRRRRVGFVFQDDALVPELTLEENIALPLVLLSVPKVERQQRVAELLTEFGLQDRAKAYPPLLSGGEKQRGAVARAVIHCPGILLADEPTANLDAGAATRVIQKIQKLANQQGMVVLVSSHDPRVFEQFPLRLCLEDGCLVGAPGC
ncbi:putative ABC transport system ATP-binding protein [Malonomonas rubra DSM 5091]|uniref:Putative ABC transport system ATP-binding protein n=1 Tax=Malonomonas rubra DSM 5091 TaxID=1122189 RepID=A0A1M6BV91_MALRU|nr:ABC transporter ATP-binding protein [Malonomonas rubra]SHI52611.1 putative ABC transport system ATP-binding protein [Malonomonas rubra DSM 5091]